jgi:hypothetical protein
LIVKNDSRQPPLRFKKVGKCNDCSVRASRHCRAVGVYASDGVLWFWIGNHGDYDHLVG